MSIGTVAVTMARIKTALPKSKISVFIVEKTEGKITTRYLDALFANTVEAVQRKTAMKKLCKSDKGIQQPAEEWLGDFDWTWPATTIRNFFIKSLEK